MGLLLCEGRYALVFPWLQIFIHWERYAKEIRQFQKECGTSAMFQVKLKSLSCHKTVCVSKDSECRQ